MATTIIIMTNDRTLAIVAFNRKNIFYLHYYDRFKNEEKKIHQNHR